MLCALEIQNVIETAFLPVTCRCDISLDGVLTVYLREKDQRLSGVSIAADPSAQLGAGRAIAELVHDLKGMSQFRRVTGILVNT